MADGAPIQMPMPMNMLESEMIGAIKIKDGLFIGDELASTVSLTHPKRQAGCRLSASLHC